MVPLLEVLEAVFWPIVRLVDGRFDQQRIHRYFESRDIQVHAIRWSPFSTGWLSNWFDRFYLVDYETGSGTSGTITCRTSWRSGVVLADDEEEFGE